MEDSMVSTMTRQPGRKDFPRPAATTRVPNAVHAAQQLVGQHCHFHGRANRFEFVQSDGVLTIRGTVPTFYLKQVLQSLLQNLDGIRWIDNQVDVVSAAGLSSVRNN
jgi:hypothetical protein